VARRRKSADRRERIRKKRTRARKVRDRNETVPGDSKSGLPSRGFNRAAPPNAEISSGLENPCPKILP
jgi:hypothetical protein